jgi:hypothetical protein
MADQTIPPALAPEGWREFSEGTGDAFSHRPGDFAEWFEFAHGARPVVSQHALAALALYGQPFGFTEEDVASLQWAAARLEKMLSAEGCEFPASVFELQQIKRLRARLAALLPPPR